MLNKMELLELLGKLKMDSEYLIPMELEDDIADNYGVLNDNDDQVEWLEFIIDNYA
jgi:hypothetical protein